MISFTNFLFTFSKQSGLYDSVNRLAGELTLVFENAMAYNRPDSKLYKDAAKLKRILALKSREIMTVFKEEGGDGYGGNGGTTSGEADDEEEEEEGEEGDEEAGGDGGKKWSTSSTKVVARSAGSRTATRKSSKSMVNAMSLELKNVRRSQKAGDGGLKKRLRALYRTLIDYSDEDERYLIDPFMDKPSKKLYPDYYEIIANPIDMKSIDSNIKNDVVSFQDFFRLFFSNFNLFSVSIC